LIFKEAIYYYICLIMYFILGLPVNLVTYTYALLHMDVIKWGKTRALEKEPDKDEEKSSEKTISLDSRQYEMDITTIRLINMDEYGYVEHVRETDV